MAERRCWTGWVSSEARFQRVRCVFGLPRSIRGVRRPGSHRRKRWSQSSGLACPEYGASVAREDDEIVCEDVGAHAAAERSEGTIQTPTHLEDALEGRDGALDSRAKALQRPEDGMVFPRPLFFSARSSLRDRDIRDGTLENPQLVHAVVEAFVSGERFGELSERVPVTLQNRIDQRGVVGPVFEYLVVGDELLLDLLEEDHVAELDRLGDLASDQQLGVRLEDTEQLLRVRELLALEDPAGSLVNDLLDEGVVALEFGHESGQDQPHLQVVGSAL